MHFLCIKCSALPKCRSIQKSLLHFTARQSAGNENTHSPELSDNAFLEHIRQVLAVDLQQKQQATTPINSQGVAKKSQKWINKLWQMLRPAIRWCCPHLSSYNERLFRQQLAKHSITAGSPRATAYFVLQRGGAVKLHHHQHWLQPQELQRCTSGADEDDNHTKSQLLDSCVVEAVRCDNVMFCHEDLKKLCCLTHLKLLSCHNVRAFNDACLDTLTAETKLQQLEMLDISGTGCTARGLWLLQRLPQLRLLVVDDPQKTLVLHLTCMLLEELAPKLRIVPASAVRQGIR